MIQTNQSFDYQGMEIAYHQSGTGKALIMMHNGGCSHIIWKNQIEHFSKTHQVIAFDLLGFGNSHRPRIPLTLEVYVHMLSCFISEKKIIQPLLMGNCIGAAIALEYTLQNPDKVQAQILCNICGGASMMAYFHPFMFSKSGETFPEKLYSFVFLISVFKFVKSKVIERLYGAKPIRKDEIFLRLREGLGHPLQPQSRIMLIKGLASFNKFDNFQEDSSGLPPLMLLWGNKNRVLPVERGKILMEKLSPTSCKIYPEEGHLLMAEAPERFNREVEDFLKNIDTLGQVIKTD